MDKNRFDGFTRQLAKRENRRQALKTLFAGGAGTAAAMMIGKETEAAKPPSTSVDCCPSTAPRLCGLTCTAVATDPNNCGACAVTCGAGQTCVNGQCSPPPAQCKKLADCASTNTDCRTATACKGGVCSYSYAAINTPVANQTPGDCQIQICDGGGNIITVPDSSDTPAAQGECFTGTCSGVTPVQRLKIQGALCSAGVCDSYGNCVQCNTASDCPQGNDCQKTVCTSSVCGFDNIPSGTGCDGGICDGSGACVECMTPADCAGGTLPNATVICDSNTCGYTCNAGYSDCSGGCFNTDNDLQHCGSCDTTCSVANAAARCSGGMCYVDVCNPGFGDCNNDSSDGCESNVTSDPNNCGGCGIVCSSNHGTPSCNGGVCQITCATGWGNCNGGAGSDGCETNIFSDPNNCGSCGRVCFTPNGTASCINGQCGIASCNAGFADCDGNPQNGCEVDITGDPRNCGSCNAICPAVPNAATICANSACGFVCNSGWAHCDLDGPVACETPLGTNDNCGSCGDQCQGGTSCVGGVCQ